MLVRAVCNSRCALRCSHIDMLGTGESKRMSLPRPAQASLIRRREKFILSRRQ